MKNNLTVILLLFTALSSYSQSINDDKTVTLTVSGTGKTLEVAKKNALRSAIEQAFGAFISTKTEVLNDNLVKDEIVSVANGNIQKYDVISQVEIPNNGYAMTLNATVSISKLTSFAQSKGVTIEIKGGLFAANIIQQELNEKAELISLKNILNISSKLLKKSFDYSIETKSNPTLNNGKYDIPLKININLNKNFYVFRKYFINSISGLTMNESEIANYEEIKKPIGQFIVRRDSILQKEMFFKKDFDEVNEKVLYFDGKQVLELNTSQEINSVFGDKYFISKTIPIYRINKNDLGYKKIFFRNESSLGLLNNYFNDIIDLIFNFEISNDVDLIEGKDLVEKNKDRLNTDLNLVLTKISNNSIISAVNTQKENFANLLSIVPIKETSNIILTSFSKFKEGDIIALIDYIDTKSLEEIKKLTEYKIKPKE